MTTYMFNDPSLLKLLSKKQLECFKMVANTLKKSGYTCRLVGGAVRDVLRGTSPDDVDVATDALPEEVTKVFSGYYYKKDFVKVVPTGIKHGTVTLVVDGHPVEVTTLRTDVATDGRHAEVEFTSSWELDAARRDFTINAMSMDVDGTVHDYFGGVEDLKNGIVKFVGDPTTRIREDYLRILRYFRFVSRIGTGTLFAEQNSFLSAVGIDRNGIETISGERIWSELTKIFSSEHRASTVAVMWAHGLLTPCGFGEVSADAVADCLNIDDEAKSSLYYIAALTGSIERLDALRTRLKFDTSSYNTVYFLVSKVYEEMVVVTPDWIREQFARGTSLVALKHLAVFVGNEEAIAECDALAETPLPKFPVTGNDLKAMGVPAGPKIGTELENLRNKWIESMYSATRDELLKEVVLD